MGGIYDRVWLGFHLKNFLVWFLDSSPSLVHRAIMLTRILLSHVGLLQLLSSGTTFLSRPHPITSFRYIVSESFNMDSALRCTYVSQYMSTNFFLILNFIVWGGSKSPYDTYRYVWKGWEGNRTENHVHYLDSFGATVWACSFDCNTVMITFRFSCFFEIVSCREVMFVAI